MTQAALDFTVVTLAEDFIVKQLRAKGVHIYPVSDQFPMKERIRRAILDSKCDYIIIGRNSATKNCETFLQVFERLYGEPLIPKPNKRAHA
jgi:hypothetical protein